MKFNIYIYISIDYLIDVNDISTRLGLLHAKRLENRVHIYILYLVFTGELSFAHCDIK